LAQTYSQYTKRLQQTVAIIYRPTDSLGGPFIRQTTERRVKRVNYG